MACCLPCSCLCPSCCSCCPSLCSCCPRCPRINWKWAYFTTFGASVLLSWTLRDYAVHNLTAFPGARFPGWAPLPGLVACLL